uniref:Endonuclease/exonuclease/phosphatase domain-containing protein n=1 Tax=Chenopodium quinoa TaxID=63459 RepID=A0A803LX10_CHEQI
MKEGLKLILSQQIVPSPSDYGTAFLPLEPPPKIPSTYLMQFANIHINLMETSSLLVALIPQKEVVGAALDFNYVPTGNLVPKIKLNALPLSMEDVWAMEKLHLWKDWVDIGAASKDFIPHAREVINTHHPEVLILLETKANNKCASDTFKRLGFDDHRTIQADGLKGGIWIMWKNPAVLIDFFTEPPHVVHALFKFSPSSEETLVTGIHAPSTTKEKNKLWNDLQDNAPPQDTPRLVIGDMNEITQQSEKVGGRPIANNQGRAYGEWVESDRLIDLNFNGPMFTWNNGQDGLNLIRERLDKALANAKWMESYPNTHVFHLPRTYSDHCPILVDSNPLKGRGNYPFRCKEAWL